MPVSRRVIYLVAALVFLPLPVSVGADFLSGSGYHATGGSLKAEDLLVFYTAGRFANQGRTLDAYDHRSMLAAIRAQVGEPPPDPEAVPSFGTDWPMYFYSPPATVAFGLLARLSFWGALAVWLLAGLLAMLAALWLLRRSLPFLQRYPYWVLAAISLGFWPVTIVFTNGQNSAFTFLVYVLVFYLTLPHYNGRYDWLAGAAAAVLALQKPQLLVGLLLVWLLCWRWKALAGLVIATAVACALTLLVLPPATFSAWIGNVVTLGTSAPDSHVPDSDITVSMLLKLALPFAKDAASLLYYAFLGAALGATVFALRRLAVARIDDTRRHRWAYVLAALFSIAGASRLQIYDLTLLLLPLLLLFAMYERGDGVVHEPLKVMAAFLYVGIAIGHFAGMFTHVQLAGAVSLAFVGYACFLLYRELRPARERLVFTGAH